MFAAEEEEWEARMRQKQGEGGDESGNLVGGIASSFEEYREKSKAAGVM